MSTIKKTSLKTTRWRERRRAYINDLKNNPCSDCGVQYPYYVMDFDHARGVKEFDISKTISNPISLKRLNEEIEKCDLLCANCHRERTHQRSNIPLW